MAAAVVVGLAFSSCGNGNPDAKPSTAYLYSFDGVNDTWCDRIDFRVMAVIPGELGRKYASRSASDDGLSCTKLVSGEPWNHLIITVSVTFFKTAEAAKGSYERNTSADDAKLPVPADIDAKVSIKKNQRIASAVHQNLRVMVILSGDTKTFAAHAVALEEALPLFVAHVFKALRELI